MRIVRPPPGTPRRAAVLADRQRIGQVLGNLLSNALRHTPAGGTVSIGASLPDSGHVVIRVADTGEGIGAEQLPHIFERFYRGDTARDRDHGGSGIGLTIAKALAEAHGGTLTADSPGPGRGAVFTLVLPRTNPVGEPAKTSVWPAAATAKEVAPPAFRIPANGGFPPSGPNAPPVHVQGTSNETTRLHHQRPRHRVGFGPGRVRERGTADLRQCGLHILGPCPNGWFGHFRRARLQRCDLRGDDDPPPPAGRGHEPDAAGQGRHPQEVRALAERIVAAQGPEIDRMNQMLQAWGEPAVTESDGRGMGHGPMSDGAGNGMMSEEQMRQLGDAAGADAARLYLEQMIHHHRGAVVMAQNEANNGQNPQAITLAQDIIAAQKAEITEMEDLLVNNGLPSEQ